MTYRPMFPAVLWPAASTLLLALPDAELAPATDGFTVLVQGEPLCIPYRVYCAPQNLQSVIARSSGDTRTWRSASAPGIGMAMFARIACDSSSATIDHGLFSPRN